VISKSKSVTCFKGIENIPVKYASNTNAWIIAHTLEDYLQNWDGQGQNKDEISLVFGNGPAHPSLNLQCTLN
jgi:hypothetical protein